MKYPILFSYYIISLIIVLIPFPWWYYSVGGIFQVYDSPFQVNLIFFGESLILSQILNILLNAFRIYVVINLVYGIVLVARNKMHRYSTMSWLPVFYFVDPIILYFVFNYLLGQAFHEPISYPFLIIGEETLTIVAQNTNIQMIIVSEPTLLFWISLIPTILYILFLLKERKVN